MHRNTGYINSTLRRYCVNDLTQYEDLLADKYCLNGISRIDANNTYFLTGYNRQENNRTYFIYFDGIAFREIPLAASDNIITLSAAIDMKKRPGHAFVHYRLSAIYIGREKDQNDFSSLSEK